MGEEQKYVNYLNQAPSVNRAGATADGKEERYYAISGSDFAAAPAIEGRKVVTLHEIAAIYDKLNEKENAPISQAGG